MKEGSSCSGETPFELERRIEDALADVVMRLAYHCLPSKICTAIRLAERAEILTRPRRRTELSLGGWSDIVAAMSAVMATFSDNALRPWMGARKYIRLVDSAPSSVQRAQLRARVCETRTVHTVEGGCDAISRMHDDSRRPVTVILDELPGGFFSDTTAGGLGPQAANEHRETYK